MFSYPQVIHFFLWVFTLLDGKSPRKVTVDNENDDAVIPNSFSRFTTNALRKAYAFCVIFGVPEPDDACLPRPRLGPGPVDRITDTF